MRKKAVSVILVFFILISGLFGCSKETGKITSWKNEENAEEEMPYDPENEENVYDESILGEYRGYNSDQMNSLAMLNYYCIIAQKLVSQKNNRLYLESTYSELYNNIDPEHVDKKTSIKIKNMLDELEALMILDVKRERIKYIYERSQAQSIKRAIPNTDQVLNIVLAKGNMKKLVAVTQMGLGSVAEYRSSTSDAEMNYISSEWELSDKEKELIHENVKESFDYMVKMVSDYKLNGIDTLNFESIQKYADNLNDDNITRRLDFLRTNRETYKYYGGYWLSLADCYYKLGKYRSCIDAVRMYEELNQQIFRKDYEYAKALTQVIYSLKVVDEQLYLENADQYCEKIIQNCDESLWQLKYYVAYTYVDLYGLKKDTKYLSYAFDQLKANVRNLSKEQQKLNNTYLGDVVEKEVPKDATKEVKVEIKKYNSTLKKIRETELPPVDEAFYVNLELLLTLADMLKIGTPQMKEIRAILSSTNEPVLLCAPLDILIDEQSVLSEYMQNASIVYEKGKITIPAFMLTDSSKITITIIDEQGKETICEDLVLGAVSRKDKYNYESFVAEYSSKQAKGYSYKNAKQVLVEISPYTSEKVTPIKIKYKVEPKKLWLFTTGYRFEEIE